MAKNILEYLEASESRFPEKEAYRDSTGGVAFREFGDRARRLGSYLASRQIRGQGVAVFMEKSVDMITGFIGAVYAGGYYCPVDTTMPTERIQVIFSVLRPAAVVVRRADADQVALILRGMSAGVQGSDPGTETGSETEIVIFEEAVKTEPDASALQAIRERSVDSDPLYVLFTSGSTGVPKGVLVPHRVILNNMEWLGRAYPLRETDVLANQVPFYFDVSDHDIYSVLKFGCSMVIVPQEYFAFPVRLVEFLNEHRVTAVFWVPFALSMAANLDAFQAQIPKYLRYIFFAGEVMPVRQLNYWRKHVPEAVYVNMYGPTETYVCTYYQVNREFREDESLPIGKPCDYVDVLVLDEAGREILPGQPGQGELCVRGCTLALGYLNSPEKTAERFVQNPLRNGWQETMYRTGDIVRWNAQGELDYLGRQDFQIKHLGYRIELGEIETAASALEGVEECACVYDTGRKMIVLVYSGRERTKREVLRALDTRIPRYMAPNRVIYLEALPRNANGKIDRKALAALIS